MKSHVFSYGISDKPGTLELYKPDKSMGLVDFAYLAKVTPKPFDKEWSSGKGIHEHDKFVVTDFNLPTAQVFTGSSNLSPSGEQDNGDNLVVIQDQKVATSYAIEPPKALVWEDDEGKVWLSYNSADYLFKTIYPRHGAQVPPTPWPLARELEEMSDYATK